MDRLKILIADDHRSVREALVESISNFARVASVVQASNGREALEMIKKDPPDVVIMDLQMPEMDGVEASKGIVEKFPEIKIVVLTSFENPMMAIKLIELGVHGYCMKDVELREIERAINNVVDKDFHHNDLIVNVMRHEIKTNKENERVSLEYQINEREKKVLKLICQEKTTSEISEEVFLSPRTVEKLRKDLANKLNVKGVVGLVRFAIRHGYDL